MRAKEFVGERKHAQLDEFLPALAAGAGALARGAAAAGGTVARGATSAARGVTNIASKTAQAARDAVSKAKPSTATPASATTAPASSAIVPAASNIGTQTSTGGQVFSTPTGTKHFANPNNPNYQANVKPTSAEIAKNAEAGLADKFGVVPTSGINTGIKQAGTIVPTGSTSSSNAASDIGQQSSTGGQTFKTATGTKHFSNPNNPNQKFADPGTKAPQASQSTTVDAEPAATTQPKPATATGTKIPPVKPAGSAPSLGQPIAAKNLADLGNAAELEKSKDKPAGFFSGLSKGFKQGMGMDPTQSLARGIAVKGLQGMNMNATAGTVANPPESDDEEEPDLVNQQQMGIPTPPAGASAKLPSPGSMFKDPRFGNVKVLQGPPGKIKLDTTKTLGYPITIDPKDLTV